MIYYETMRCLTWHACIPFQRFKAKAASNTGHAFTTLVTSDILSQYHALFHAQNSYEDGVPFGLLNILYIFISIVSEQMTCYLL